MDARIFEPDCLSAPSCIDKRDDVADGDEATDDVFEPVFCERIFGSGKTAKDGD